MTRQTAENSQRRADQSVRQARVGILRNPNDPPPIPPRRAQLMGRWPDLRSTRRQAAPAGPMESAAVPPDDTGAAPPSPSGPVRSALADLTGVDLATLIAEIDQHDSGAPLRSRYGGVWRLDPAFADPAPPSPGRPPGGPAAPDGVAHTPEPVPAFGPGWLPGDAGPVQRTVPPPDLADAESADRPDARRTGLVLVAGSAAAMVGLLAVVVLRWI